MKSIIQFLTEYIVVAEKFPYQKTQDKIEDEKLSQMKPEDRLKFLEDKEKKQKKDLTKGVLMGIGAFGALGVGTHYLTKNN